jgi:hypothetical protein
VAEDPSNWELARRLDDIHRLLGGLVGDREYKADQRGTERRLAGLEDDLAEERRERAEAVRAVRELVETQAKRAAEGRMSWRSALWTGLLPALVAAIGVIVTVLLSHGGH